MSDAGTEDAVPQGDMTEAEMAEEAEDGEAAIMDSARTLIRWQNAKTKMMEYRMEQIIDRKFHEMEKQMEEKIERITRSEIEKFKEKEEQTNINKIKDLEQNGLEESKKLPISVGKKMVKCVKEGNTHFILAHLKELDVANFRVKKKNNSLLHVAAEYAQHKVLHILLKNSKLQADNENSLQETALHVAASTRNGLKCVKILKKHNADANKRNNKGETPLHYAARNGFTVIVKTLMDMDANVNIGNDRGEKPSDVAKSKELRKLIQSKTNIFSCSDAVSPSPENVENDFDYIPNSI